MSVQPGMFGRPVDQDSFRGKSFCERGAELKFADDFDAVALLTPPLQQRRQGLGFARKPMPDVNRLPMGRASPRVLNEGGLECFQRGQSVEQRCDREKIERGRVGAEGAAHQTTPEAKRFLGVAELEARSGGLIKNVLIAA